MKRKTLRQFIIFILLLAADITLFILLAKVFRYVLWDTVGYGPDQSRDHIVQETRRFKSTSHHRSRRTRDHIYTMHRICVQIP